MAAALASNMHLLGEGAREGSGASAVSSGTTSECMNPAIFPPSIPIKLGEPVFVEYFSGEEDPLARYEQLRNMTPYLKVNGEGKVVAEQQRLRNSRVSSLQAYLVLQERLSAWMVAVGRFSLLDAEQHRGYVHALIVPFAATYTWTAVIAFDHSFRVAQHLQTVQWTSTAPALVQKHLMANSKAVVTALGELKTALAKVRGGGQPSARSAEPGRLKMKHTHTEGGDEICITFQVGKCTGGCGRAHVCHVCRLKAVACKCTSHKRGSARTGAAGAGAQLTTIKPSISQPAAKSAAEG